MFLLNEISQDISEAKLNTIMANETANISDTEQLVICNKWVSKFISLCPLERTTADDIVKALMNTIKLMEINIENACDQCYDETAIMSGSKNSVATQIKTMDSKCLFTHCYGHVLNLAINDIIKKVKKS